MKKLLLTIALTLLCSTSYGFGLSDLQVGKSTRHDVIAAQLPSVAAVIGDDLYAYETIMTVSNSGLLYTVYHFKGDTLSAIEHTNARPKVLNNAVN